MAAAVFHTLRLEPGADVMQSLQQFAADKQMRAGFIAAAVGSITSCTIRFANAPRGTLIGPAHFEVCSLCGTVALSGCHVHIVLSDGAGACVGGHLLEGSRVYTTLEIVLGEMPGVVFSREPCAKSGWDELVARSVAESVQASPTLQLRGTNQDPTASLVSVAVSSYL